MSKLTFRQQVETMRNCRTLVSMHGAGLTNMLFMQQPAKVLEFRTKHDCFIKLTAILGHEHHGIRGQKMRHGQKTQCGSDHHSDFYLDPEVLVEALDQLRGDTRPSLPPAPRDGPTST
jgi:hypothetical protein